MGRDRPALISRGARCVGPALLQHNQRSSYTESFTLWTAEHQNLEFLTTNWYLLVTPQRESYGDKLDDRNPVGFTRSQHHPLRTKIPIPRPVWTRINTSQQRDRYTILVRSVHYPIMTDNVGVSPTNMPGDSRPKPQRAGWKTSAVIQSSSCHQQHGASYPLGSGESPLYGIARSLGHIHPQDQRNSGNSTARTVVRSGCI